MPEDFEWEQDEKPDAGTSYRALVRAIQRAQGFNLQFVRCSLIKAKELIKHLESDFPQQKTACLEVNAATKNLYEEIQSLYEQKHFDILFVQGLEDSMLAYEQQHGRNILEVSRDKGYGGKGWENVPIILGNLNLSREKLRDNLPITLVFFLPEFALNYFIRRAPDFFDWRSNIFEFATEKEKIASECNRIYVLESDFEKYQEFNVIERINKIKEIISYLNEVEGSSEQASLWAEKGLVHALGQEYEEAIASYDKALEINSDYQNIWNNRGAILCDKLGRYEEAIVSFDKALEINPDFHYAHFNRGIALKNLGRYEEAIASYDKALEINPDYQNIWNGRGVILCDILGRYEEAIVSFDKAIEINPDFHDAHFNRGIALTNLGRYEEAIASYDKALEINPDYHNAWNSRGSTLGNLGRDEEAITSYDKALEINPDFHDAHFNRGIALKNLGRYEEAIFNHKKALEIRRDIGDTQEVIQSLQALIGIYQKTGDFKKTFQLSQEMTALIQQQENWLDNYPIHPWMKIIFKFTERGKFQFILGWIIIVLILLVLIPYKILVMAGNLIFKRNKKLF